MDVIPLDASLPRGSHGRAGGAIENSPVIIASENIDAESVHATRVKSMMLDMLFGARRSASR